jgi:hypothetical protein
VSDGNGVAVITDDDRLGVNYTAGAGGRIAVMTDGDMTGEVFQGVFRKDAGDAPHPGKYPDGLAIGGSDAGALLATVLESEKSKKCETGYILFRGENTKNTARLVQN